MVQAVDHTSRTSYVPAPTDSTPQLLLERVRAEPGRPLYARPVGTVGGTEWHDVRADRFLEEVRAVAKGLVARGVRPGDRVGLMSRTRYEWTLFDFGIWFAGAVVVPLYDTSAPDQVRWALSDAAAVACVVETPDLARTVDGVRGDLPALEHLWTLDEGAVDDLVAAGAGVGDDELDARVEALRSDALATIIYTSGTTGRPKGCELTHGNFVAEARSVVDLIPEMFLAPGAATLLFLPLAHVFARVIEVACAHAGVRLAHTADARHVVDDFASYRPTFILAVPRVFEKVYNGAEQKAIAAGKGRVFAAAATTAEAWSRAQEDGGPGLGLRLRHALFDRLVYGKLRAALGGQVSYAVSGGAPLGARLGHFFRGVGITVVEGYGLTETTAAITANPPSRVRMGTVGVAVPGAEVRTAPDGEVLLRGPMVFRGYYGDPEATRAALDDEGWFRSGDLGEIDADGYLRITGRKKEIIVTAGGKNVAPSALEDRLRAHPLISQCLVVGDARPYIGCLVTLDADAAPAWLEARDLPVRPVAELAEDPAVLSALQEAVDAVNATVSRAESIRRFRVLPTDFTQEGGELTPKMSIRRQVVLEEYAAEVEALYS